MAFTAGTQVGPYRIMEQLGQGGMAVVYKAYHASLDRYVAIKVLHRAFMEDTNFQTRFQREARVVARLEHPNIVPIYDYAEYESQPYLVMKYIEGETLKARLRRGSLSADEITHIVEKVGAALAYAHRQGILHRDVKPSNVINANDGQIYLADFGLARIAQSGESTLTTDAVLGTPQYISPEQAMAKKDLDEGTDIYSFGAMLYEMTVGRVPFTSDTPFSIIHDHIYTPLPLPSSINPDISPVLERVLLKALAKERADRYKDVPSMVAAFKEAWTSSAATVTFSAAPSIPQPVPAPTARASSPLTAPMPPQPVAPPRGVPAPPAAPGQKQKSNRWIWFALGLPLLCVCCLFGFFVFRGVFYQDEPTIPVFGAEPTAESIFDGTPIVIPDLPEDTATDLPQMLLDQAKKLVDDHPKDARAHMMYGLALVHSGQETDGYDEIKKGVNLADKNQAVLLAAAKSFEEQGAWLAAAIVDVQIAKNAKVMPAARVDAMQETFYYGFQDEQAPNVLDYSTISDVDPSLALIAQASYLINYADDESAVQPVLDQLEALKPGLGVKKLLQAQYLIDQDHETDAKTLLQGLIDAADTSAWVKDEATTLLSDIQ